MGRRTFFGDLVYDRAVSENRLLPELERVVDWSVFTERLVALYGGGER